MDTDLLLKALIAIAPVIILLLVFDRLDIFNLISFRAIGLLVLTGGAIAGLSFFANGGVMDGFPIGRGNYSRYVSPLIEESLKAIPIVVLFALNRIGFKLDSAIAGFAVGAGFSVVENGWDLNVFAGANITAWLVRGFGTAIMHGGTTALFAVISHEFTEHQAESDATRYRFKPQMFLPGLAAAIALHSGFNHFPDQPILAMALTLLLVPLTLFFVFARSERATHQWLRGDYQTHLDLLQDIRAGHFATSNAGRALTGVANRFHGAAAADALAYIELKIELILRAEEIMLAKQDGRDLDVGEAEREKFERLQALEWRLGRPVLAAIDPQLGLSRNDLWELAQLRRRARKS